MPVRMYRHLCPAWDRQERRTSWRKCTDCGAKAEFYRWEFGVIESWARYNWRTGLPPLGAKPPELKDMQITRECRRCNGHGLLGAHQERGCKICPECRGAGGFPVLDRDTIHWVRLYAADPGGRRAEEARKRIEALKRLPELDRRWIQERQWSMVPHHSAPETPSIPNPATRTATPRPVLRRPVGLVRRAFPRAAALIERFRRWT